MVKKLALILTLLFSFGLALTAAEAGIARFRVLEDKTHVSKNAKLISIVVKSNLIWSEVPQSARPLLKLVLTRGLKIQSCAAMHMTKRLYKYVQRKGGTLTIRLIDFEGDHILTTKLNWHKCN